MSGNENTYDVVVVGAGITGLSLSYYLNDELDVLVLESESEPGGVIKSKQVEDTVLELGPQRMRLTPRVEEVVEALELRDEVIEADMSLPMYVYHDSKLRRVPFSITTFLTTDLLSYRGKIRVLKEPFTTSSTTREEETVAEYFSRKFGSEAYENFLGPLFGGIYGSDPSEMYARHSLSRVLKADKSGSLLKKAVKKMVTTRGPVRSQAVTFESGNQSLVESLYEHEEDRVELGNSVEEIRKGSDSEGYVIEADSTVRARKLVFTTPAEVTADLISSFEPQLSDRLVSLNYNPIALVHLEADTDREGFGYQVHHDEDLHTLGVTWNASLFSRDSIHTVFLGGMHEPELIEEDDSVLGEIATEEFSEVIDLQPSDVRTLNVHRWERGFPAYDRSWDSLDGIEDLVPEDLYLCANYESSVGIPGRVRESFQLASQIESEVESGD